MKLVTDRIQKGEITPRITLIGAGPGDPDLLTIKGMRALNTADVVLYDALVNEALLNYAPESAVKVFIGKPTDDEAFSQKSVNKLIIDYALNFGHVVRLKSGDPFFFARGYEEIDFAESYSIPSEIIPGISSATGAPSLQKIPMIHKGLSESFWAVSGSDARGNLSADLRKAAASDATVVVLNGLDRVAEIAAVFQSHGKNRLPVAVIENGSTPAERVVVGVADTIAELVEEKKIAAPALLVFGAVVSLHPQFQPIRDFYELIANEGAY
ncbi:uroporphyrinogen-III C-methyltransferase [Pedobacter yulinensis]|uniref:uroporphyrinogen-III C-methyltransferase n=1 Tax=Pedobacter yulinensis TaxID=2126353 RepID=A0A2T3HI88_9SPHI|nr:uroporphyrinogen-III C-methyltransferase [Pedobacter yulinensis]PST82166.1 uroporphyrinogen-III C-methyltransferase [Pedobacter yulinensis]